MNAPVPTADPTVFVVDDDPCICDRLRGLVRTVRLAVETFGTAEEFLDRYDAACSGCLVVAIRMPGMSGLELQEELCARGTPPPIIILTAYGDVPTAVRAFKMGAVDFVQKPFSEQLLLDSIRYATEVDRRARCQRSVAGERAARLARLTPREREVTELVIAGKSNRVIGEQLRVSEKTVEFHRAHLMKKLGAQSLAELCHLAQQPVVVEFRRERLERPYLLRRAN